MNDLKTIYTNGISLFTLENFGRTAGVSHFHNITVYKYVSYMTLRNLHSIGKVHYITGIGDRKELANRSLSRKTKLNNFQIH